nr:hypothetical protein [Pseudomonas sp. ADAK2]
MALGQGQGIALDDIDFPRDKPLKIKQGIFMSRIFGLILCALVLPMSGCVQGTYTKSVQVTKDETGRVVQTIETESVTQVGQGNAMRLEKIKGVQN